MNDPDTHTTAADSGTTSHGATGGQPYGPAGQKLSEQLAYLHQAYGKKPLHLRELVDTLGKQAPLLAIILLTLPFTIPLPIPLSTPFGLAIVTLTIAVFRGKEPRFSERTLNAKFPPGVHDRVIRFAGVVVRRLERWLKPGRAVVLLSTPARVRVHVAGLFLSGVYLLLPLPVPFSNTFPAWAIMFVTSGLIGRDGVFLVLGHATLAAGVLYLLFLGGIVATGLHAFQVWLVGLF